MPTVRPFPGRPRLPRSLLVSLEALAASLQARSLDEATLTAVLRELSVLPPARFRAALSAMVERDLLDEFVGNLDPAGRRVLFVVALANGFVRETPQRLGLGRWEPPAAPGMIVQSDALPLSVRNAIHAENCARVRDYHAAYGAYQDRFLAAVAATRTPEELRGLGLPDPPATFVATGAEAEPAYQHALWRLQQGLAPHQDRLDSALAAHVARWTAKPRGAGPLSATRSAPKRKRSGGESSR